MNMTVKLAIGTALALTSAGAFAQTVPTPPYTTVNTGPNGSLMLTLFSTNDATPFSYSFNTGLNFNDVNVAGMNTPGLTLTWSLTNLATDLGTSAGVAALANGLVFDVSAASAGALATAGGLKILTTADPTSVTLANVAATTAGILQSSVAQNTTFLTALGGAGMTGATPVNGYYTSTTIDPTYANANYNQTYNNLGFTAAGSTSSALPFYLMTNAARSTTTTPIVAPTVDAGTWTINLTADTLTYSVGGSSVPLPASLWLLMSGVAGVLVLGRRRKDEMGFGAFTA